MQPRMYRPELCWRSIFCGKEAVQSCALIYRRSFERSAAPIKAVLLDQQRLVSGVGNWIADEILYQARVAPHRRVADLEDRELETIRRRLGSIVSKAVEVDSVSAKFPRTWLFHHRWGRPEDARTRRGEQIEITTVAGRTTAWVPLVQR